MVRTIRFQLPVLILTAVFWVNPSNAQTVSFKNFTSFQNIVPGVDFFASNRQTISPYEEASTTAIERLKNLLGDDLPKGAIFICSNQAQLDSLYEPVVMRQGYSWVLISSTPEVRMQTMLEQAKAQLGDNIPEEIRQRMNSMSREVGAVDQQTVTNMARNIAFAVLHVMMNRSDEYFQFRASRVEDVGKSPLQDWLDVSIGAYASGDKSSIRYLQENLDMMFPIEDVLFMARPYVSATASTGGGGQGGGMPKMQGGEGGGMPKMQGGGPGGEGGGRGGAQGQGAPKAKTAGGAPQQRVLSKAEQDRLLFDGQAISFFDFFMEKFGIEKIRELIQFASEKNESWEYVVRPDRLGRDFSKIEPEWTEWLMKQSIPDSKPKPKAQ